MSKSIFKRINQMQRSKIYIHNIEEPKNDYKKRKIKRKNKKKK